MGRAGEWGGQGHSQRGGKVGGWVDTHGSRQMGELGVQQEGLN